MTRAAGPFPNLPALFLARAAENGDRPFLWRRADGAWTAHSWAAVARDVARLAEALRGEGLAPGERVMIVSENRPEWAIADLAIMAAGGVSVPAYTSNTTADHAHILADSGAAMAIVSTARLAATLRPAVAAAPACRRVIGIEPGAGDAGADWDTLLAGRPGDSAALAAAVAGMARDDLACLIYTSGTGGAPRGVRLHHGAILANAAGCLKIVAEDFGWAEDELFLSLLPLSHAFEHTAGLYLPIALGGQIAFCDGPDRLVADMAEMRPTIMVVVPRLFEVLRQRITRQIGKQGRLAQWMLARALAGGIAGRLCGWPLRRAIKRQFGGRLKALVSGGAPLNPEVGRFFEALGLTLLQGYGQTEAAPVISCNRPAAGVAMATVGPPLAGVTVRIAADGEILVRGESVMHGYWNDPAATAAAIVDGWLHTGDIGVIDAAGRLAITDRKKDLIVTDKGENIAPQRIEGMLTLAPEIGQAMVAGDRRPHLVALLVPDADWARGRAADAIRAGLAAAVDRTNAGLAVAERVRRFALADEPFAIENRELTPSLKIRRHAIRARYGDRLDALYAG